MDDIRGQLCGFYYPSGHRDPAIFQDFYMNAYKEHRTKPNQNKTKQNKTKKTINRSKREDGTGCNHINVQ